MLGRKDFYCLNSTKNKEGKLSDFDLLHVIRLPSLEFSHAGIVPQEEKDKAKGIESQLKIQLFFFGQRVEKKALEIIAQEEVKRIRPLLGEKVLIKFKVSEEVFKYCYRLGLRSGAKCDWIAVPQPWGFKNNKGELILGIWFMAATLLRLNGKEINYQILKNQSTQPVMQDAFAYFGFSNSTHTANSWDGDASLGDLEKEIDAELEGAAP